MSHNSSENKHTEIYLLIGAVIFVLIMWFGYPTWVEWKDESIQTKPNSISPITFENVFKKEPTFIPYSAKVLEDLKTSPTIEQPSSKLQELGEKYGTFGDTYGALNTLFSGLAFAVLIITMLMQRRELQEQRKDIEEGKEIAKQQKTIADQQKILIDEQVQIARIQNFYFIFFQYLESLDTQLNRLNTTLDSTLTINHERIFSDFSKKFIEYLHETFDSTQSQDQKEEIISSIILQYKYEHLVQTYHIDLNETLYLEHILMILNLLNENKKHINIQQFINTLLAHISSEALLCLTWIAIIKNSKLKLMIEQFGLLKKLNNQLTPERIKLIKKFIDEKAFREI
ncbi:hypothetical protein ACDW34_08745 [Acinetobacter piscicola]|uniref:hypothetical protein n=1 Tax=Acinetobacter piscicola TaxID=2006115 RepID=UPI0035566EB6